MVCPAVKKASRVKMSDMMLFPSEPNGMLQKMPRPSNQNFSKGHANLHQALLAFCHWHCLWGKREGRDPNFEISHAFLREKIIGKDALKLGFIFTARRHFSRKSFQGRGKNSARNRADDLYISGGKMGPDDSCSSREFLKNRNYFLAAIISHPSVAPKK